MIGHPNDPLHPFSDADMLVEEVPNARLVDANSILEWRLSPGRLNDELAGFLDQVFAEPRQRGAARPGAGGKRSSRLGPLSVIRYPGLPDGDPQGGEEAPPGREAGGRAARRRRRESG